MISPIVGNRVWFTPGAHETNLQSDQPLAGIVTYVHSDALINLVVFGKGGDCHQRASVPLWDGEGESPERITYAELAEGNQRIRESKPSPEPVQPIPPSPVYPDPYASSVE